MLRRLPPRARLPVAFGTGNSSAVFTNASRGSAARGRENAAANGRQRTVLPTFTRVWPGLHLTGFLWPSAMAAPPSPTTAMKATSAIAR